MKNLKYLSLIAAIFTGEYFLKNRMEKELESGKTREILKGRILLRKYHNEGACLNLGEKKSKAVAAVSLLLTAALSLVFLFTLTRARLRRPENRAFPPAWRRMEQHL